MSNADRERAILHAKRKYLYKENRNWPTHLVDVPKSDWPEERGQYTRSRVMRSRYWLVQQDTAPSGFVRLAINRTTLGDDGMWEEDITWDELMTVKREAGFGDQWAVEVCPPDNAIVNVANIRWLWILPAKPPFTF